MNTITPQIMEVRDALYMAAVSYGKGYAQITNLNDDAADIYGAGFGSGYLRAVDEMMAKLIEAGVDVKIVANTIPYASEEYVKGWLPIAKTNKENEIKISEAIKAGKTLDEITKEIGCSPIDVRAWAKYSMQKIKDNPYND